MNSSIQSALFTFLLSGVVYGATAGISPGPLLALVIRESLAHDRKAGITAALAPLVTDIPIVCLSLLFVSRLSSVTVIPIILAFAGGAFLIYLGIETLLAKPVAATADPRRSRSFWRAVLTNTLSPNPYMFWLFVGAPTALRAAESHRIHAAAFIAGFYVLLVGTKIAVACITAGSKQVISSRWYGVILRVLGVALLAFAAFLIRDGFQYALQGGAA